ncbi:MAG: nucleotidyl transferase AbiEii/AbiGii toxin family protein [Gammaproteobacteria bacterium]|nr:nucleotidyl transferase AbiEii/AbiGii toxin family protein [Gammaproteobacteria bacterium]
MFRRPHHQRIALVLQALDTQALRARDCLFGGGTAIALRYGEFRESVDMDFLVSDPDGYRELRQALRHRSDLSPILRLGAAVPFNAVGEVRADRYGIRTVVTVVNVAIKFEIVFEARIDLDPPKPSDDIAGIACLAPVDMVATKLLANSDRWSDPGVFSRDLIDLAMMQASTPLLDQGINKAAHAYGRETILSDLGQAIERMADQPKWLGRCLAAMAVEAPQALVWQRIRTLRRLLGD